MKKIITAINNPKINEEINKNPNIETISKDVQYREAILELLEQFKNTKIGKKIFEHEMEKMDKLMKEQNVNKATKVMMDL